MSERVTDKDVELRLPLIRKKMAFWEKLDVSFRVYRMRLKLTIGRNEAVMVRYATSCEARKIRWAKGWPIIT